MTPRVRIVAPLQRLVLRLARTPLRPLLALAYQMIARATAAYLIRGERDPAVYLRGGVGAGDFHPGLSDLDLVIILPDDLAAPGRAAERVKFRWERLRRALPFVEPLIDLPRVHEEAELEEIMRSSAFTYGLHRAGSNGRGAAYFSNHSSLDLVRSLERPGLYQATGDWARLAGRRDRRPVEPGRDQQGRRTAAWLELVWTWRAAFPFIADPRLSGTTSACVKLIAEPARILLWLTGGELASGRADVLRRALARIPEEESALRRALDLHGTLSSLPPPPLAELLPCALRLSARVAALIGEQIVDAGASKVRLAGEPSELVIPGHPGRPCDHREALALADWRAVATPELPDESFLLSPCDPRDPGELADAAQRRTGPYPALRAGELMIFPAVPLRRTRLRAVKSRVTDPVPFAIVAGEPVAELPEVHGWSARDMARRGVAEHRAWLERPYDAKADGAVSGMGHQLGRLLTAARAALFLESVEDGTPELCLTVAETARRLAARFPAAATITDEALGSYRDFALADGEPRRTVVAALRALVLELPGYVDADALSPPATGGAG